MKAFIGILFLTSFAQAQLSLLPTYHKETPSLAKYRDLERFKKTFPGMTFKRLPVSQYSEEQISTLANLLHSQFQNVLAPLEKPQPACASPELARYLLALQVKGQFDRVTEMANSCADQITSLRPFLIAALTEATRYEYARADRFFEMATDPRFVSSADYTESLFQRASYSLFGSHEDQVDGILAQIPGSTTSEQALWKGILKRVGEIDVTPLKKSEIDAFLAQKIQETESDFRGLLLSLQIRIALHDARYDEAIQGLLDHADEMQNPLAWYYLAYDVLYYGLDQNFAWARKIYDAYNPFAHPWMNFPQEGNTYTYTEIFGEICHDQLVQPEEGPDFYDLKKRLRTGEIHFVEAIDALNAMKSKYEAKADFLAMYASLLSMNGQHEDAIQYYFKSHQACAYYNRAHWGLTLERRFAQYSHNPEFEKLNARVDRELAGRTIPDAIATYIVNWNALTRDSQKRVAFGSRIWLPYMQTLQENNMHTYIKFAFDLLSESPDLSDVRDARIGGEGYPNDNRLWDDVRGVGGSMVVADLGEVYNGVQGDYNLIGHEMAHQFQFLMEKIYPSGLQCIVDLYGSALAHKNFPDSYAAQNKEEYFAQGVTYYLVPKDSPARFGLNQTWVEKNDPDQFQFVTAIDQARGDMSQIHCQIH